MRIKRLIKRVIAKFSKKSGDQRYQERHQEENRVFIEKVRQAGGSVGKHFDIYDTFFDTALCLANIGNNVTITGATILTHDASMGKFLRGGGYCRVGHITIGNDVFIGRHAIVLAGTTIGNRVIVGAGAVVSGTIPDNSVVVGNPARVLCTFDEYLSRQEARLEKFPTIHNKQEFEERKSEIVEKYKGYWSYFG